MKLTLQIKLLPGSEQAKALTATMRQANAACNRISQVAWDKRLFNQYRLHHVVYKDIRESFGLSAQVVVRCISKVADSYKVKRGRKRHFKPLGGITYDPRILRYLDGRVSIWTVEGRQKIPFVCHNPKYLPYIKGEADLVYKKGRFFLFQTVEVPEEDVRDVEEFIGVDFGIRDIASTSDGHVYNSKELNEYREKRFKVRRSLQRKGTKGARVLLKRLSGKEARHATTVNHTISKRIVQKAGETNKGIAIEDLRYIRERTKVRRAQRRRHHSWAFGQLRAFIEYKSCLAGVPLIVVNPAYTSQTCHQCKHIGRRKGKHFECPNCGLTMDADLNAAFVIAQRGASVNRPEKNEMFCRLKHVSS